jgi:hypothetical protein
MAAGQRVRENAVTRLSQRRSQISDPLPATPPEAGTRASSAPPTGRSARSIPDVIAHITSAINNAEGHRTQHLETLQIEQVLALREEAAATKRSAAALERIADAFEALCNKLGAFEQQNGASGE